MKNAGRNLAVVVAVFLPPGRFSFSRRSVQPEDRKIDGVSAPPSSRYRFHPLKERERESINHAACGFFLLRFLQNDGLIVLGYPFDGYISRKFHLRDVKPAGELYYTCSTRFSSFSATFSLRQMGTS